MVYVTSDLHGYPLDSFKKLLDSAGFCGDDFLFVLGDVIDRNGDGGVETLLWMMEQPNVELILGNHEDMLLNCRFLFEEVTDESLNNLDAGQLQHMNQWMLNGSKPTMDTLGRLHKKSPETVADIIDYLWSAPFYDSVALDNGDFFLVHGGIDNFHPDKPMNHYSVKDLLWHRPRADERFFENMTTIMGHTPTSYYGVTDGRAFHTPTWIDIDTGAASGGAPMLLRLDDMQEFYAR